MTRDEKTMIGALAVVVGIVLLAFGLGAAWPLWLILVLLVVLAATPWVTTTVLRRRKARLPEWEPLQFEEVVEPEPEPEPSPIERLSVTRLPLPSADPDYRFLLSATVYWRRPAFGRVETHPNPAQVATTTLVARAGEVTASAAPDTYHLVQHQLNAALGVPQADETGQVEVWADDIVLGLPEDDEARLSRLATLRKNIQLWEQERDHERDKRTYLLDDVLKSPGSAVVWWLSRDTGQVEDTVRLIGKLAELSAAANDREVDRVFRRLVPDLANTPSSENAPEMDTMDHLARVIDEVFAGADEEQKTMFSDQLAKLVSTHGAVDLAEEIRVRYRVPDVTADDAAMPEEQFSSNGEQQPAT